MCADNEAFASIRQIIDDVVVYSISDSSRPLTGSEGECLMLNKVLVLSASAGAGHLRAADAVLKAINELGAAREARHIDSLDYTNKDRKSVV